MSNLRNNVNGRGVHLMVSDPPESFFTRVPGAHKYLKNGFITLAPRQYNGVGASSAEIVDSIRFFLDAEITPVVTTGYYGDSDFFYEELTKDDMNILVGRAKGGIGYAIPNSSGALIVYCALQHAIQREKFLNDVASSLVEGYYNRSWEGAGVSKMPVADDIRGMYDRVSSLERRLASAQEKITDLRVVIKSSAQKILATKASFRSSTLAVIRRSLEDAIH